MASPHGSGGGGTGQPHSGTTSSSSSWDHAATAGPHPAPGELEREHLVSHAINGQEMVDTFQQAAASQQGSSSTCHQPHAWNSSSTAGPDNVSRNFLGAGDEGGSQQQTQPSACDAVPTSINGGIPRVELSSSSRGVGLHNPQHLGWMQTRAYQHGHSSHNGLTAAVMASQQPSQAPRAVGTFVGMPDGTDAGMAAPHAVRVPLSSALGQAGATELENFGIAGMGASGVGARGGQGAAWEGSAWEGSGAAGSGAAGGLVASSVAASLHFSAQAAGGVVIQPPLPADSGARDELDAPLPLFAAPGGDGAGDEEEEEEDDSVADRAPIAISIPDGFSLKARSWCCGRSETIRSICSKCNARWHCHISHGFIDMDKDRFICCFCDGGGRTQSGCKCKRHSENLRVRANSARRAQDGIVRRSAVERTATRRKPATSAFKLPVQLDPLVAGDSSSGGLKAVYSVSTTARGDRYTVITNFDPQQPGSYKIVCCNNECTSTVHAQEPDLAENVQRRAVARCEHTIVVVGSETVPVMTADIPDAEPVVFGKDGEGFEAVANQAANELKLG
ncbi:unnamed protein product [Ectocarpus sp. CCAP 1310/34]|nr:unnamed protein product [Ectocarpus sp. CCAP 1310/34]